MDARKYNPVAMRACCPSFVNEDHHYACKQNDIDVTRRIKADEKGRPEQEPEQEDVVEQPTHYARWVIQPLKFIMANGFEFWRGNIVKYACRAGYKTYDGLTPEQSEVTDLKKVIQYAKVRIEELEGVS